MNVPGPVTRTCEADLPDGRTVLLIGIDPAGLPLLATGTLLLLEIPAAAPGRASQIVIVTMTDEEDTTLRERTRHLAQAIHAGEIAPGPVLPLLPGDPGET